MTPPRVDLPPFHQVSHALQWFRPHRAEEDVISNAIPATTARCGLLLLIVVRWCPVLSPSLPVMTPFAQCLPVTPVPEELLITTVWNDVIHHRGFHVPAVFLTRLTERMRLQELFTCSSPSSIVSTATGRPHLFRMHGFMLLTVLLPCRHELRTARVLAGDFRFRRHQRTSPHSANFSKPPIRRMYSRAISTISP